MRRRRPLKSENSWPGKAHDAIEGGKSGWSNVPAHPFVLLHIRLRVNDKFGPVIDYVEIKGSHLPIVQRVALWLASDVLIISAIR